MVFPNTTELEERLKKHFETQGELSQKDLQQIIWKFKEAFSHMENSLLYPNDFCANIELFTFSNKHAMFDKIRENYNLNSKTYCSVLLIGEQNFFIIQKEQFVQLYHMQLQTQCASC